MKRALEECFHPTRKIPKTGSCLLENLMFAPNLNQHLFDSLPCQEIFHNLFPLNRLYYTHASTQMQRISCYAWSSIPLAFQFPKVHTIQVARTGEVRLVHVTSRQFPALQHLHIHDLEATEMLVVDPNLQLATLDVHNSQPGVRSMMMVGNQLQRICCQYIDEYTMLNVTGLMFQGFQTLMQVRLSYCSLSIDEFNMMAAHLQNLQVLEIRHCSFATDDWLFLACPQLKQLDIDGKIQVYLNAPKLQRFKLVHLEALELFEDVLEELEEFHLEFQQPASLSYELSATRLPSVRTMCLRNVLLSTFSFEGFQELQELTLPLSSTSLTVSKMPQLHTLHCSNSMVLVLQCPNLVHMVQNRNLQMVPLHQLQTLSCWVHFQTADEPLTVFAPDLYSIFPQLPQLSRLQLRCAVHTNSFYESFHMLQQLQLLQLRHLSLSRLTVPSLLITNFPQLQSLQLLEISSASLSLLQLPQLQDLTIEMEQMGLCSLLIKDLPVLTHLALQSTTYQEVSSLNVTLYNLPLLNMIQVEMHDTLVSWNKWHVPSLET